MFRSPLFLIPLFLVGLSAVGVAQTNIPPRVNLADLLERNDTAPGIEVHVVLPEKGELLFDVEARNADLVQVLRLLAERSNEQIVVKAPGKTVVPTLSLHNKSLTDALKSVCEAANLTCQLLNDIWLISTPKDGPPQPKQTPIIDDLMVADIDVSELLALISNEYKVPIIINNVGGTVPFIRLKNTTPRQAIDAIALAVDLIVDEQKDGTLSISKTEKEHQANTPPAK